MDRIYLWFADNGNIRRWHSEPFENGVAYVRQQWQPIESAPKDDSEILVIGTHKSYGTALISVGLRDDGFWFEPLAGSCLDELMNLTHWMPLPEPPAAEAQAEGK